MTDETTGTDVAEYRPKAELITGNDVSAIVPRSADEAYRLATAVHKSGLAPSSLSSPEKLAVAIMTGLELGLPPMQSIQSIAVINGRPSVWGDAIPALLYRDKFMIREWLEGEGDNLTAWCEVKRPDTGQVTTRSFSVQDAKDARLWGKTGPWQTSPKRMLQMRARGFAARDGAADVLRGIQVREEAEDYANARPDPGERSDLRTRLEARGIVPSAGFTTAKIDDAVAEAGADEPTPEAEDGDGIDWNAYADSAEADIRAHKTIEALDADWKDIASRLQEGAPEDVRARLTTAKLERHREIMPKAKKATAA